MPARQNFFPPAPCMASSKQSPLPRHVASLPWILQSLWFTGQFHNHPPHRSCRTGSPEAAMHLHPRGKSSDARSVSVTTGSPPEKAVLLHPFLPFRTPP